MIPSSTPLWNLTQQKLRGGRMSRVSGLTEKELLNIKALRPTWAPKVCKIMALMAIIMGLGLLFYLLLGFR